MEKRYLTGFVCQIRYAYGYYRDMIRICAKCWSRYITIKTRTKNSEYNLENY